MIKYYSFEEGANEMSKAEFERAFKRSIKKSMFDKLTDIILTQYVTNINMLIYSTGLTFNQILNSEFNASVGFTGPAIFYINGNEYSMNQKTVNAQSFQLSIRKEDDKILIRLYTNDDSDNDHVAAVIDKQITAAIFTKVLKNLIRYFIALNVHDEEYFNNFTGVSSMQIQNILNKIAIDNLN